MCKIIPAGGGGGGGGGIPPTNKVSDIKFYSNRDNHYLYLVEVEVEVEEVLNLHQNKVNHMM